VIVSASERSRSRYVNIYVGNLPFNYDSQQLEELFSQYGEVESAQVILDRDTGRSRGFGFVELADDAARKAIEELDGTDVSGRSLTVNEAKPRSDRGRR
jgi:RNA recognition motif-containing protein